MALSPAGAAAASSSPAAPAPSFGRGWRRLPRDARDTLFLLAVIGWTVLPHVGHLPAWCSGSLAACCCGAAGWRCASSRCPGGCCSPACCCWRWR